ncbi:hypothetical protein V6615_13285 [Oscillospiraceae bacterium PP1C4]
MTKVIVIGHGGYGTGVKDNLMMLVGETNGFYFVDFNLADDVNTLEKKIHKIIKRCCESDILFCCDLAGGSPFRLVAVLSAQTPQFVTVAGLNTAAYTELVYNLELSARELGNLAVEVSKSTVIIFPPESQAEGCGIGV